MSQELTKTYGLWLNRVEIQLHKLEISVCMMKSGSNGSKSHLAFMMCQSQCPGFTAITSFCPHSNFREKAIRTSIFQARKWSFLRGHTARAVCHAEFRLRLLVTSRLKESAHSQIKLIQALILVLEIPKCMLSAQKTKFKKNNRRERNSNIFWKSVVYAVAKCVQYTKYITL